MKSICKSDNTYSFATIKTTELEKPNVHILPTENCSLVFVHCVFLPKLLSPRIYSQTTKLIKENFDKVF